MAVCPVALTYGTALEAFLEQCDFCRKEGSRFRKCGNVGMNSCMFYENKVQELKWEMHQLKQQYEEMDTGDLITLHRVPVKVPVSDENESVDENQIKLTINDLVYLPEFPSKKTYHFRYVVCLPLQKHVLQESKTELFKQCEVGKVLKNMIFEYPRSDEKMQESLRRGYLTIELYAARKLKSPYIIGATRIPLSDLFTQSSLTGTINLGEREKGAGLWEMSYSVTIRRPQNKDARENFTLVEKTWLALEPQKDSSRARRSSIACMNAKLSNRTKKSRRHSQMKLSPANENLSPIKTNSLEEEKEEEENHQPEEEKEDKVSDSLVSGNTAAKVKKTFTRRLSTIF